MYRACLLARTGFVASPLVDPTTFDEEEDGDDELRRRLDVVRRVSPARSRLETDRPYAARLALPFEIFHAVVE